MREEDTLAEAFRVFMLLRFPPAPTDERFDDWMMDLHEIDGYIAGRADSKLNGRKYDPYKDVDMPALRSSLEKIAADVPHDAEVIERCLEYLTALENVQKALS